MLMLLDDPMAPDAGAPMPDEKPFTPAPPRFAVSEGAGRYVGFWLVVFGIMAFLAAVALLGFGPH